MTKNNTPNTTSNPAARQADRLIKIICSSVVFLFITIVSSFSIAQYIYNDSNGYWSLSSLFWVILPIVSVVKGIIIYFVWLAHKSKQYKKLAQEQPVEQVTEEAQEVQPIKAVAKNIDRAKAIVNSRIVVKNRLVGYFNSFLSSYFDAENAKIFEHNMEVIAEQQDISQLQKLTAIGLKDDDLYHIAWNIGYIVKQKDEKVTITYKSRGQDMAEWVKAMFSCKSDCNTIMRNLHDTEHGRIKLLDMLDPDIYSEEIETLKQIGIIAKYKKDK